MGLKQRSSGTFFNLKIEDQAFPKFHQVGKENGEWVTVAEGDYYEGTFVDAKIEEYEYKKETQNKLVMEFHDEDGNKETVSCNFNSLALNIINTLAGQDSLVGKKIAFTVYSKKDKEGEDRARIYIEINGQKTEWKYGPDILTKIHKHPHKWVDMFNKDIKPMLGIAVPEKEEEEEDKSVFDEYNEAQEEKPKAKAPVKGKKEEPKAAAKKAAPKKAEPEPEPEEEEDFDDDLPF